MDPFICLRSPHFGVSTCLPLVQHPKGAGLKTCEASRPGPGLTRRWGRARGGGGHQTTARFSHCLPPLPQGEHLAGRMAAISSAAPPRSSVCQWTGGVRAYVCAGHVLSPPPWPAIVYTGSTSPSSASLGTLVRSLPSRLRTAPCRLHAVFQRPLFFLLDPPPPPRLFPSRSSRLGGEPSPVRTPIVLRRRH